VLFVDVVVVVVVVDVVVGVVVGTVAVAEPAGVETDTVVVESLPQAETPAAAPIPRAIAALTAARRFIAVLPVACRGRAGYPTGRITLGAEQP
jgi:hypothetical protein